MAGKKSGQTEETEQDRALAEVSTQKVARFRKIWAPLQRQAAVRADKLGDPNSVERRQATGQVVADTDAVFQQANQRALGATNELGSSGQKLGITSMGNDQATSVGLGTAQVNQNVDAARIGGMTNAVNLGQGKEALALSGLQAQAGMARQNANADAEASLQRDIGTASLVGQGVGLAAGAYRPQQAGPRNVLDPIPAPGGDGSTQDWATQAGGVIVPDFRIGRQ